MRRAATLVRQRAADIAPIFTLEQGKTLSESLAEIERSATFLSWDAEEIRRLYGRITFRPTRQSSNLSCASR